MCNQIWRQVNWISVGLLLAAVTFGTPQTASADQCIPDDLVVDGSINCGFDSVCNRNFGFDTLVLSENNLRIFFEDTSTSASFPDNDWRILINQTSNGGDEFFAIEDTSAGRIPFTIQAGARANALFIRNGRNIGFGTALPVVNLHIVDGNTPTVRLDQDGSQGFTPQIWDLAGNEANFFIRDVTNGAKLPFRIVPGAPTNSLRILANGDVGLGTSSPSGSLHINRTGADAASLRISGGVSTTLIMEDLGAPTNKKFFSLNTDDGEIRFLTRLDDNSNPGGTGFIWRAIKGANGNIDSQTFHAGTLAEERVRITAAGNIGLNQPVPVHPLHIGTNGANGNGAHCTAGGMFMNGSSREFKDNIASITTNEAREAVMRLEPVTYNYKMEPGGEQYAGFIAEDVPDLVATNSRKFLSPMDIVSVVTKVVQDQQQTIERQQETISAISERLEQLESRSLAQD